MKLVNVPISGGSEYLTLKYILDEISWPVRERVRYRIIHKLRSIKSFIALAL